MTYQVHGYFENPRTSKSKELARFTHANDFEDLHEAYFVARDWVNSDRYPFVFVQDSVTKISSLMVKETPKA